MIPSDYNDLADYAKIEIEAVKVCRRILSPSSKLFFQLDAIYIDNNENRKIFTITRTKLKAKTSCKIPLDDECSVKINIILSQNGEEDTHIILAKGLLLDVTKDYFRSKQIFQTNADIFSVTDDRKIGKICFNSEFRSLYSSVEDTRYPRPDKQNSKMDFCIVPQVLNSFRFKKLSGRIKWERLKSLNIERLMDRHDSATLMSFIDDVATGDVSDEDVDNRLRTSLHLAQLSAQYILACHEILSDKQSIISNALKTFDKEEEYLDLEITKLKAKIRAQRRENELLDEIFAEQKDLLDSINPELADDFDRKIQSREMRKAYEAEKERMRRRDKVSAVSAPTLLH